MNWYLFMVFLLLLACTQQHQVSKEKMPQKTTKFSEEILIKTKEINSFVYQLQHAKFDELNKLNVDLLVIDPDDAKLTADEIRQLNKTVLAYISIGEAEDYRDYWQPDWKPGRPTWIDNENPAWKGNYKIKYWEPEWQQIVFNKLNNTIKKGYNGVYLDIIDGYVYWNEKGINDAQKRMINFVKEISARSKQLRSDFFIVPQNAVELLEDKSYLNAIDGIGRESLWYHDNSLQEPAETENAIKYLDKIKKTGKTVLIIDYPTERQKICSVYTKAAEKGYVAYVPNRALDRVFVKNC